jgi:hypothetical protein
MTHKKRVEKAEEFVSAALTSTFRQTLDDKTLREVAAKVAKAVEVKVKKAA